MAGSVMKGVITAALAGCVLLASSVQAADSALAALHLKLVQDVPLPGPANRLDYQSYDSAKGRLFIAHLAANTMIVLDTKTNNVVGEVKNLSNVHGVLAVPQEHRVYASATGSNEIVAVDEDTLKIIGRMDGGVYPDGLAYAPGVRKLYVSNQAGRTETVIDTRINQRIKTIPLGGEAGNSQYDAVSGHIFVNVQTRSEIAEIDPATDTIVARHPLAGAQRNHGLLIDAPRRVAYVACEGNSRLLIFDLRSMKVTETHAVGDAPDVLALDEGAHLLYVAAESGVVALFRQDGTSLRKVGQALLARRAHTVAAASDTHRAYFPIENAGGRPVLRIVEPTPSGAR